MSLTTSKGNGILSDLLRTFDDLPPSAALREVLARLPPSECFQGQEAVVTTMAKLRKYRSACNYLVRAASRFGIFRHSKVSAVTIRPPKLPTSDPGQSHERFLGCLKRMGLNWDSSSDARFGVSLPVASAQFQTEMASLKPKVHAEIQHLFHYEINSTLQRPRVICSSKSACFLCDRFLRLHGEFFIERSHGVLYSKWTLPNVNQVIPPSGRRRLHELVDAFAQSIQREVGQVVRKASSKRTHPNESLISVTEIQQWGESNASIGQIVTSTAKQSSHGIAANDTEMTSEQEEDAKAQGGLAVPTAHIDGEKFSPNTPLGCHLPQEVADNLSLKGPPSESLRDEVDASTTIHDPGACSTISDRTKQDHSSLDDEVFREQYELLHPSDVRSSIDLGGCRDLLTSALIKDHGSRLSDTSVEYDKSQADVFNGYKLSYSAGVSQRIDLHELELFLESSSLFTIPRLLASIHHLRGHI